MLSKLLYLNSNIALTLGYLNPALNNSAQYIGVAFSMIGWAVVLVKKTTQHVDEPLLVLRVSEEIVLLQCDFHVLCEGDSCSGFPYCSPLVSQVLCRHVVVPIKHDDSVSVLLRHIAAV